MIYHHSDMLGCQLCVLTHLFGLRCTAKGKSYEERACCESGGTDPSESCPATAIQTTASGTKGKLGGGAITGIVVGVLVLICCLCGLRSTQENKAVPKANETPKDKADPGNNNVDASYDGMSAVMPPSAPPLNPAYVKK